MANHNDKKEQTPFIPTLRKQPSVKPTIVEKVRKSGKPEGSTVDAGTLSQINADIVNKTRTNDNILQLFPEIELFIQILTSNIMSPNDVMGGTIGYSVPDVPVNMNVTALIVNEIKSHLNKHYKLQETAPQILREALFTKGSYVNLIVPESSFHDLISRSEEVKKTLSTESDTATTFGDYSKAVLSLDSDNKLILGDDTNNEFSFNTSEVTFSAEDDGVIDVLGDHKPETVNVDNDALSVEFLEDVSCLKVTDLYLDHAKQVTNKKLSLEDDLVLSTESESALKAMFSGYRVNKTSTEIPRLNTQTELNLESEGMPLWTKVPSTSIIPIHLHSDPSKHTGYILLLDDQYGILPEDKTVNTNLTTNDLNQQMSMKDMLLKKASDELREKTNKKVVIKNAEEIYISLMEESINNKIKSGLYGEMAAVSDQQDAYRVIFNRALKKLKTKLLFIPKELVTYYAFEYGANGVGVSLLEKSSILYSLRSILLFAGVKGKIESSIPISDIKVELDPESIDPEADREKIIQEYYKSNSVRLPVGVTGVNDISEWLDKAGHRFNFKHPTLPDINIDISKESVDVPEPNNELEEQLKQQSTMLFSLNQSMVESGYDISRATKILSDNVLLAKRVDQYQKQFTPMLTEQARCIISNDTVLRSKIKDIIKANLKDIKKSLKKKLNDGDKEQLNSYIDNDELVIKILLNEYIDNLQVTLPGIDMHVDGGNSESLDNQIAAVEKGLEVLLSTDTLPPELVGNIGNYMDPLSSILKMLVVKKWMNENNYMTELSNMVTLNTDGEPEFNLMEDYVVHVEGVTKSLLPLIKTLKKSRDKVDEKLDKIENGPLEDDDKDRGQDYSQEEYQDEYQGTPPDESPDEKIEAGNSAPATDLDNY